MWNARVRLGRKIWDVKEQQRNGASSSAEHPSISDRFIRWILIGLAAGFAATALLVHDPFGTTPLRLAQAQDNAATTATPVAPGCTLMLLGDSLTAGYGLSDRQMALPVQLEQALKASGRNIKVLNGGVSGDTSRDLFDRLNWSMREPANVVMVAIGGNDLLRGLPAQELLSNVDNILKRLRDEFKKPVALIGLSVPRALGKEYRTTVMEGYRSLAQQYNAPLYENLFEGILGQAAFFQDDGIHPNAEGARMIANNMTPFVSTFVDQNCQT